MIVKNFRVNPLHKNISKIINEEFTGKTITIKYNGVGFDIIKDGIRVGTLVNVDGVKIVIIICVLDVGKIETLELGALLEEKTYEVELIYHNGDDVL